MILLIYSRDASAVNVDAEEMKGKISRGNIIASTEKQMPSILKTNWFFQFRLICTPLSANFS